MHIRFRSEPPVCIFFISCIKYQKIYIRTGPGPVLGLTYIRSQDRLMDRSSPVQAKRPVFWDRDQTRPDRSISRHHAGTISAHYANQVMMMKKQKVGIKPDLTLLNVNSVKLRQLHSLIALQQSGNFNLFFSNEQVYMRKRDLNCLQTYKKEND